ncbi:MAG: winged helix-turn-helix transcriptional regulator [Chloroflexota bacterium]|nr:MAG: winged helix-turn-helix transcriptional regulator [Chloroflexota bacterium]
MAQYDVEIYKLKAELCKTFADPKRLIIINQLREGETTVNELARVIELPQAVVSRHLAILRDKGVVQHRREGTSVYYSLSNPKIGEACDMMHQILLDQVEKNKQLAERLTA